MIGVFDSGVGGLTVLKEFLRELPEYDYLYVGDNARAPYGGHSHDTLLRFTRQAVDYLFDQGCALIITACNTVSAQVLREIQNEYLVEPGVTDKKILGVLRPVAEAAATLSPSGRIGVVGTRGTISSQSYEKELRELDQNLSVVSQACPLLVPLIEENWHAKPETKKILRQYLKPLKSHNIDTLILACTHYPFLIKDFHQIMGKRVNVPHPGEIVASSLKKYLKNHPEIESRLSKSPSKTGKRIYQTTDDPELFANIATQFLPLKPEQVQNIQLPAPQTKTA